MNPGALPIEKCCLPSISPDAPALKSAESVTSRLLVRPSITGSVLVLLTSCFDTQYCNTPAALPGLIDCTFGRAQCVVCADICACASQTAQPNARPQTMSLIML